MKRYIFSIVVGFLLLFSPGGEAVESVFETHTTASCTGTSGVALAANVGRTAALLVNDATSPTYLRIDATAVASEGIRLNANGGNYYISDKEGNLDREAINCITGGTTNVLLVIEWSN